jgi:hypothetical protein
MLWVARIRRGKTYDGVKVGGNAVVSHNYVVSSNIKVLIVKRLVDIADELDGERMSMVNLPTFFNV